MSGTQTVSQAVEKMEQAVSPARMVEQYAAHFARVLPSHIKTDTWVRVAQGALRKGRKIQDRKSPDFGQYELVVAARNNPGVFLTAMLDAARLGLEPGTEQYYLTPRKIKGRLEILPIVGYQGYIELMYRAGAVASVIAEVVRANDRYSYRRGVDRCPVHEYPPFEREAARGPLVGTYAYATMKDGAISRVVELNQDDIDRIRAMNPFSAEESSPWQQWETAMWLKSGVRQLRKWVPTSAEFHREQARALGEAQQVAAEVGVPVPTGVVPDDAVDGEIVEDWPQVAEVPDGDDG